MKNQDRMKSLSTSNKQTPERTPVEAFSGPTSPTEEEVLVTPHRHTHRDVVAPFLYSPYVCPSSS